ncbi:MAG: hypothetical protein IKN49_00880 [Elusimicrobiaceae bacterium]|nr:hypothetical protein [Elusimicrobiaceae bacterium]
MLQDKLNPQYATLDVLLMMLLYNAKKPVQIPTEIFKKHSLFFAKHHTVSVLVQCSDKENIHADTITLKCTNKSKLRRLIEKYLSLYRRNKVSSNEVVLGCEKMDAVLTRIVSIQGRHKRKISFEFTNISKRINSGIINAYPLDTASFVMACSYNGFPVRGSLGNNTTGKKYFIVEVDDSALWDNVVTHVRTGWRVRLNSTQAKCQGHPIEFDRSSDKQKRLLDMLVSSKNGVADTDKIIRELEIDNTNRKGEEDIEFALERIRELGREIRKKVNKQCKKDGYGQANFRIEVDKRHIRLIDVTPV